MQYERELLSYLAIVEKKSESFSRLVANRRFRMLIWRGWNSLFVSHFTIWIHSSGTSEPFHSLGLHAKRSRELSVCDIRQNCSMQSVDSSCFFRFTVLISTVIQTFKQQLKASEKKLQLKIKKVSTSGTR